MASVYLDNGATTSVAPGVLESMLPYFSGKYGNASSLHQMGGEARHALEESRAQIADSIGASPDEIFFTSGGTESNNLAIKGAAFAAKGKKHIVTTRIEHSCVLNSCKWLERQGYQVTYLPVDSEGFVSPDALSQAITSDTLLASIIHGNNEIGTVQDLAALGKICSEKGVPFHTDACQSYTKVKIDASKQSIGMMTINSHKIGGPKGVGALYIKKGVKITPLLHGGGHEKGMRSGTENIAGIVGFAKAAELAFAARQNETLSPLRDRLISGVLQIKGTKLNGPAGNRRLCNNANFSFLGVEGEAIVASLDQKGIFCSTGSACSEANLEPSHVLTAIGLPPELSNGSLRVTLSRFTTNAEIDYFLEKLPHAISRLRKISPFGRV
jgi:cysteine desulfurase